MIVKEEEEAISLREREGRRETVLEGLEGGKRKGKVA